MHMRRGTDTPHTAHRTAQDRERGRDFNNAADDNYTKLEYVNNVSM